MFSLSTFLWRVNVHQPLVLLDLYQKTQKSPWLWLWRSRVIVSNDSPPIASWGKSLCCRDSGTRSLSLHFLFVLLCFLLTIWPWLSICLAMHVCLDGENAEGGRGAETRGKVELSLWGIGRVRVPVFCFQFKAMLQDAVDWGLSQL